MVDDSGQCKFTRMPINLSSPPKTLEKSIPLELPYLLTLSPFCFRVVESWKSDRHEAFESQSISSIILQNCKTSLPPMRFQLSLSFLSLVNLVPLKFLIPSSFSRFHARSPLTQRPLIKMIGVQAKVLTVVWRILIQLWQCMHSFIYQQLK